MNEDTIELPEVGEYVVFRISGGGKREGYIEEYHFSVSGYPTSFTLSDNLYISYPLDYIISNRVVENAKKDSV